MNKRWTLFLNQDLHPLPGSGEFEHLVQFSNVLSTPSAPVIHFHPD